MREPHIASTASYLVKEDGLLLVRPPRQLTDEGVRGMLDELRHHHESGRPFVVVFDLSEAGVPNAVQRRMLAEHVRERSTHIERRVRRVAMVAESRVLRGMITAVQWVAPIPVPSRVFADRDEAIGWVRGGLPG